MKRIICFLFLLFNFHVNEVNAFILNKPFMPVDSSGEAINAHAGCIISYKGIYYWYGEKKSKKAAARYGFIVYKSEDLNVWHNEGLALKVSNDPSSDIQIGSIMERPKVIYNKKNKLFVLYFHLEKKGMGYQSALVGVATSDNPIGPFKYIKSFRLNANTLPLNEHSIEDLNHSGNFIRDNGHGQMSRDMTIFVDDDEQGYLISSSEGNSTLIITRMKSNYLGLTSEFIRVDPGGYNEAPVMFKDNGEYFLITSGSSGWSPNKARLFSSKKIFGNWKYIGSPVVSSNPEIIKTTFGGQGAFSFNYLGKLILSLDIWNDKNLASSKYLWTPIRWDKNNNPYLDVDK